MAYYKQYTGLEISSSPKVATSDAVRLLSVLAKALLQCPSHLLDQVTRQHLDVLEKELPPSWGEADT